MISFADFLAWEQLQERKHELLHGLIVSFSGGSLDHAAISGNVFAYFKASLPPHCRAYGSDAILETASLGGSSGLRADVVVTCSPSDTGKSLSVKQPRIVIEVLSPSNTGPKWTNKTFEYWNTASIEQFVTIDSSERSVTSFVRDERGNWQAPLEIAGDGVLEFPAVRIGLNLTQIYAGTSLAENA